MMVNYKKRTIGVNFNDSGQAEISVWAPLADKVSIRKNNGEDLPLNKGDLGYWHLTTKSIRPNDRYQILVDDKTLPDPTSLSQPDGVHGASEAIDINNFKWSDTEWNNIALEEYIIYELHTGTFTPEGTFAAIENKLDYLLELGINAIEIMPVAQFSGDRNWGYDGVYPFCVQNSYGGAKGLQHLVNICHQKGIAVILDVVYNHLGPEGNYLGASGPYFTDKYKTPWGNAINFDDEWCDGVRRYFIENALMWFRDFHIDALRLDAVHAIKDFSPTHILKEIKLYVNELMQATGRRHYLITELDLNDTKFINPIEEGGYGMDAQWIDEFHHALRVTASGDRTGYYSDFTDVEHVAKSYKDAYVYDGQFSPHRKKHFGIKAEKNEGKQFIVFSQNHDQVGNRMLGERTSQLTSFEMQKLLAGAVIISPYLPMLFMGEEWSEPNPFLYFVSHTDPELAEAVRKGRKAEFAAFHAEGEAPDPMSEETFTRSKLQWNLLEQEHHETMFQYYKTLIQLRKSRPALRNLNRKNLHVDCDKQKQTVTLRRWHEGEEIVCVLNFSKQQQYVDLPRDQEWKKILDSASPQWKGPVASLDMVSADISATQLTIQPEALLIYSNQ